MAIRFTTDCVTFEADTPSEAVDVASLIGTKKPHKKGIPRKPIIAKSLLMQTVKWHFDASGWTLSELGLKMGYPPKTARQSVFQFMKSNKPRLDVLQRFAKAMDIPVEKLINS